MLFKRAKKTESHTNPVVLLMGLPNVGKSAIFNKLTGLNVRVANYPGTTVELTAGKAVIEGKSFLVVDVPGIYTMEATTEAETVAVEILDGKCSFRGGHACKRCDPHKSGQSVSLSKKPEAVICVVDANSLESSLYSLLELIERGLPIVVALNRIDLAQEKGSHVDPIVLSRELGVPVVSTIAATGYGIESLKEEVARIIEKGEISVSRSAPKPETVSSDRWQKAERLAARATRRAPAHPTLTRQKWGDALVKPWPGLPFAALILSATFAIIVGLGMGLRHMIFLPLVRGLLIPQIVIAVEATVPAGMMQNILIGNFGFLIKGLEWPIALILPYVISFYIALSILEDSGYLPRLACLLDGLLHRIGVHGSAIIPLLLGYGCGIPAIMATRSLHTYKERQIVAAMICLSVPCIAQTGAFIVLLVERSIAIMLLVFLVSVAALVVAGVVLDRTLKGSLPPVLLEVPELLLPKWNILAKRIWTRIVTFIISGELPMIAAIGVGSVLYETGVLISVGKLLSPIVVGWLGLPEEASIPLILGILRRELAVLPLIGMDLSLLQLFVGAIVGLFYVPCVAILAILVREFNAFTAVATLFATVAIAFLAGGIFYRIGSLMV